jgi:hypothetical protein
MKLLHFSTILFALVLTNCQTNEEPKIQQEEQSKFMTPERIKARENGELEIKTVMEKMGFYEFRFNKANRDWSKLHNIYAKLTKEYADREHFDGFKSPIIRLVIEEYEIGQSKNREKLSFLAFYTEELSKLKLPNASLMYKALQKLEGYWENGKIKQIAQTTIGKSEAFIHKYRRSFTEQLKKLSNDNKKRLALERVIISFDEELLSIAKLKKI